MSGEYSCNSLTGNYCPAPHRIEKKQTRTKADGTYLLKDLITGQYAVMIGDTWDWHQTFDWRAPAHTDVRIKPNETYSHVDFQLTPGAFIKGRVTDGDTGTPIERIQIRVSDAAHPWDKGIGHSANTDAHGRYRFRVASGRLAVWVNARKRNGYYAEVYGWPELEPTGYIREGQTISDIDFVCYRGFTLVGVVKTVDNKPLEGASVETQGLGGGDFYASTDEGGNFKLEGIRPNKGIAIVVEHAEKALRGVVYVERLTEEVRKAFITEVLTFNVPGQMTVTINKGTSNPASSENEAQIEPPKAYGHISGRVVYRDSGNPHADMPIVAIGTKSDVGRQTRTDPYGKYTFIDLPIDDYTVMIGDLHEWHTTSIWRAPAQKGIRVSANETETGVDFQLTTGGIVEVSVTAIDTDGPVGDVLIRVFDAGHPESISQGHWATTNADGRCAIRIAAGDFMVVADTTNTGYYLTNGKEALRPKPMVFEGVGVLGGMTAVGIDRTHLRIKEGQRLEVMFKCHRGLDISGVVQTETGEPVSGALIRTVEPSEFRAFTESVDGGEFTLKGFPKGFAAGINVVVPGTELHGQGYFFAGQNVSLKIIVSHEIRGVIVGRVIDENGNPMAGVPITLHSKASPEVRLSFRPVRPLFHTEVNGGFVILPLRIRVPIGWASSGQTPSEELAFPQVGQEYQISASANGYEKAESEWIVLQQGSQRLPDFVLKKLE